MLISIFTHAVMSVCVWSGGFGSLHQTSMFQRACFGFPEGLLQISPVERGVVTLLGVRSGLFVAMNRRGKLYGSVSVPTHSLSDCPSLSHARHTLVHTHRWFNEDKDRMSCFTCSFFCILLNLKLCLEMLNKCLSIRIGWSGLSNFWFHDSPWSLGCWHHK